MSESKNDKFSASAGCSRGEADPGSGRPAPSGKSGQASSVSLMHQLQQQNYQAQQAAQQAAIQKQRMAQLQAAQGSASAMAQGQPGQGLAPQQQAQGLSSSQNAQLLQYQQQMLMAARSLQMQQQMIAGAQAQGMDVSAQQKQLKEQIEQAAAQHKMTPEQYQQRLQQFLIQHHQQQQLFAAKQAQSANQASAQSAVGSQTTSSAAGGAGGQPAGQQQPSNSSAQDFFNQLIQKQKLQHQQQQLQQSQFQQQQLLLQQQKQLQRGKEADPQASEAQPGGAKEGSGIPSGSKKQERSGAHTPLNESSSEGQQLSHLMAEMRQKQGAAFSKHAQFLAPQSSKQGEAPSAPSQQNPGSFEAQRAAFLAQQQTSQALQAAQQAAQQAGKGTSSAAQQQAALQAAALAKQAVSQPGSTGQPGQALQAPGAQPGQLAMAQNILQQQQAYIQAQKQKMQTLAEQSMVAQQQRQIGDYIQQRAAPSSAAEMHDQKTGRSAAYDENREASAGEGEYESDGREEPAKQYTVYSYTESLASRMRSFVQDTSIHIKPYLQQACAWEDLLQKEVDKLTSEQRELLEIAGSAVPGNETFIQEQIQNLYERAGLEEFKEIDDWKPKTREDLQEMARSKYCRKRPFPTVEKRLRTLGQRYQGFTVYIRFCRCHHPRFQAFFKRIPISKQSKLLVSMWLRLSHEQKVLWKKEAQFLNNQEVEVWLETQRVPKFDDLKFSNVDQLLANSFGSELLNPLINQEILKMEEEKRTDDNNPASPSFLSSTVPLPQVPVPNMELLQANNQKSMEPGKEIQPIMKPQDLVKSKKRKADMSNFFKRATGGGGSDDDILMSSQEDVNL